MARKKKGETGKFSGYDLDAWFVKTEKRISNIQYGKDFESLKVVIIKLLSKIKKEPNLIEFEPRLVLLLKECNLNIQFIRRNEDCWNLLRSGHPNEALEEIIHVLKDINTHPDKYLIKPDIRGLIVDSIKKISEKAESEVKILPELNLSKSNIKTIKPLNSEQILPDSIHTTGNTFKQKLENFNPFDISAPIENPFEKIKDEKIIRLDKPEIFKTYFHQNNLNPNENKFESDFVSIPGQDIAQKLSEDQMNSINTYWSKQGEEKGEKVQQNDSLNIKTQKISNEKQKDKKKKADNPWSGK